MYEQYLLTYHRDVVEELLKDNNIDRHYSININFVELFENDPNLGNYLLKTPQQALDEWNKAALTVQNAIINNSEDNLLLKQHVHCRIYSLIRCPELHKSIFPRNDDANKFLQVSGTVVRMTCSKILEFQRKYTCNKCKHVMIVCAEIDRKNMITTPRKCENCDNTSLKSINEMETDSCKDYQEIKIQETVTKLDLGCMPNSMWVILEDDLVDSCKPGDNITICGIVKRRWNTFTIGRKLEIELVLYANHIQVNNNTGSATLVTPETKIMFQSFWETYANQPLAARDIIIKSICPQIFGLYVVKLAIAVILAGGSQIQQDNSSNNNIKVRSEPHLLLVGDPGTGKSQLLRFASKIVPRSVLTTGVGSTAAGLTVTAVMENGEWQLEGGALVLADGGICCIDEFNSMKEHDRTSIHEAMEQQTISVAKASIVCKLSTKCSILAATNPKGNLDPTQPLTMNIALASPLLSRFDLILLLRDRVDQKWDNLVVDYILNNQNNSCKLTENISWTVETLQAYFAVIKKNHPTLTPDSHQILSNYYQAQRRKNLRNKSRTTVRLLDSLIRLSQGHARLMFHKQVEIIDAIIAVMLIETAMDPESAVFNLQFDIQSDFPTNPMECYKELVGIMLKKLQLEHLFEKELENLTKLSSGVVQRGYPTNQTTPTTINVESKYFNNKQNIVDNQQNNNNTDLEINERKVEEVISNDKKLEKVESGVEHEFVEDKQDNNAGIEKNNREENSNEADKIIKDNAIVINDLETNNKKVKRSKNKTTKSKKPKIGDQKEIVSDLTMLNLLPSINDPFALIEDDHDTIDIDFDKEFDSNNKNFVTSTQTVQNPDNNKEMNVEKTAQDTVISQTTKRRQFFNKFRFQPKEDDSNKTEQKSFFEDQNNEINDSDLEL